MIWMEITNKMRVSASYHAKKLGNLPGSMLKGKGNMVGMLGEEIFQILFPKAKRIIGNHDYDFLIDGCLRVDVKTQGCSYAPKKHGVYNIPWVTEKPRTQECDIYYFCRALKDHSAGWAVGWQFSSIIRRDGIIRKKGETLLDSNQICRHGVKSTYEENLYSNGSLEQLMLNPK